MSDRLFTRDHEWLQIEEDLITIGITDYAQEQLGDVVYVELPKTDDELSIGDEAAVIESVKAAGEVKSPVVGVVVETNETLADAPETLNEDAEGTGWLFKLRASNLQTDEFMNEEEYKQYLESL